jgi:hypothetical protein
MRRAHLTKSIKSTRHNAGILALKGTPAVPTAITTLPRPVLDRIHRYAAEKRVPVASYRDDCCLLLAVANWKRPAVILRSSRDKFSAVQSAALSEWKRAAQQKTKLA